MAALVNGACSYMPRRITGFVQVLSNVGHLFSHGVEFLRLQFLYLGLPALNFTHDDERVLKVRDCLFPRHLVTVYQSIL